MVNPTKKLALWRMVLNEFHFDVQYRPGPQQGLADPLSRLVLATLPADAESLSLSNFAQEQQADAGCCKIVRLLGQGDGSVAQQYMLNEHGVLCLLAERYGLPLLKPVVPETLVSTVLRHAHDGHAHRGREGTRTWLKENFHWPSMYADTIKHITQCNLDKLQLLVFSTVEHVNNLYDYKNSLFKQNSFFGGIKLHALFHTKEQIGKIIDN